MRVSDDDQLESVAYAGFRNGGGGVRGDGGVRGGGGGGSENAAAATADSAAGYASATSGADGRKVGGIELVPTPLRDRSGEANVRTDAATWYPGAGSGACACAATGASDDTTALASSPNANATDNANANTNATSYIHEWFRGGDDAREPSLGAADGSIRLETRDGVGVVGAGEGLCGGRGRVASELERGAGVSEWRVTGLTPLELGKGVSEGGDTEEATGCGGVPGAQVELARWARQEPPYFISELLQNLAVSVCFGGLLFLTVLLTGSPLTGEDWAPSPRLGAIWSVLRSAVFCFALFSRLLHFLVHSRQSHVNTRGLTVLVLRTNTRYPSPKTQVPR